MKIIKPYRTAVRDDGAIQYEFKEKDDPEQKREGAYFPRGAVCWPILNEVTGYSEGFIICAAQHVESGTVIIFDQMKFRCIDHILRADQTIEYHGISGWLNNCYARYLCDTYYRSGNDETHKLYLLQVIRSQMIKPQPHFPNVNMIDSTDAQNVLFTWRTQEKIVMEGDSELHNSLLQWENTGRKVKLAAVEAMLTLVNGYQKYPYQKQYREE